MDLEISLHDSIRKIRESDWNALDGVSESPSLSYAFLDALEQTGCVGESAGWLPHHIGIWNKGELIAAAPAYLKDNSEGEFVFDWGWASASHKIGVPYYPKLVVAVPFTPAAGRRLLVRNAEDRSTLAPVFAELLRKLVELQGLSSAHVLFPTEEEAKALAAAKMAHRYGIQFQFQNKGYDTFDDFLGRFNAKRRHQIRRERREIQQQGIVIETLRKTDITPAVVDAMFDFYLSTVQKFYWGRQYLNRAFFEEIVAKMPDFVEVVLAKEGKKSIAGTLNLTGPKVMFGRYWGTLQERPFLHFNVCYYHPIEDCIRRRLDRFEPGAGGSHKLVRGFEPTVTHSAHHLSHPALDAAVRDFVKHERAAIEEKTLDKSVAFR